MPDMEVFTEELLRWTVENALLFSMIGNLLCLAPFLPIWSATRKRNLPYQSGASPVKAALSVALSFIGLSLILTFILNATGIGELFSYETVSEALAGGNAIVRILAVVIIIPMVEELCFRGIILNRLLSWTKVWVAAIIQAVLFGVAHLNLVQGVYAFIVGLVFGLIYVRYRKLWLCIAGHMAFNLPSAIISLFPDVEADISIWVLLISGVVLAVIGIYLLIKQPAAVPVESPPEPVFPEPVTQEQPL